MTSLEALQTLEQDSGWIKATGTGIPRSLSNETDVVVKYRNGRNAPVMAAFAHHWKHTSHPSDIVAYRLHKPSPSSQGEEQ